jgi:hypothetical protein
MKPPSSTLLLRLPENLASNACSDVPDSKIDPMPGRTPVCQGRDVWLCFPSCHVHPEAFTRYKPVLAKLIMSVASSASRDLLKVVGRKSETYRVLGQDIKKRSGEENVTINAYLLPTRSWCGSPPHFSPRPRSPMIAVIAYLPAARRAGSIATKNSQPAHLQCSDHCWRATASGDVFRSLNASEPAAQKISTKAA